MYQSIGAILAATTLQTNLVLAVLFSLVLEAPSVSRPREDSAEPPITAVVFSSDYSCVIAASQMGLVIQDWPSLAHNRTKDLDMDSIHDLSLSPDGKQLLVAGGSPGDGGVVQLRSWPELKLVRSWTEHSDVVYKIAWRGDGLEWSSASWDGFCRICMTGAPKSHTTIKSHSGPVFAAAYLSDASIATAGGDRTIAVSSPSSGQPVRILRQHTASVHSLVQQPTSRDGSERLLASAGDDRTVRFWQPSIGRMVRFHRFTSMPRSIAWTHDGRWLMVGCDDGSVVQLDPLLLTTKVISQQEAGVSNVAVSANNESLCISVGAKIIAIQLDR